MQQEQWIAAFATCLVQLWPRLEPTDGEHVAEALWRDGAWRQLGPEEAAARWAMRGNLPSPPSPQAGFSHQAGCVH